MDGAGFETLGQARHVSREASELRLACDHAHVCVGVGAGCVSFILRAFHLGITKSTAWLLLGERQKTPPPRAHNLPVSSQAERCLTVTQSLVGSGVETCGVPLGGNAKCCRSLRKRPYTLACRASEPRMAPRTRGPRYTEAQAPLATLCA